MTILLVCTNSNCERNRIVLEREIVRELGTGAEYLKYDEDRYCEDCKHEMEVV